MESLVLGEERRRGNCVRDADDGFNSPDDSVRRSSSSLRRGLSKHYKGKSQSFTSLSEALTVEDLAKPENPFNVKLKQRRAGEHSLSTALRMWRCIGAKLRRARRFPLRKR
ncbi:hypothetical protein Bca101_101184 [Brassica carinata]